MNQIPDQLRHFSGCSDANSCSSACRGNQSRRRCRESAPARETIRAAAEGRGKDLGCGNNLTIFNLKIDLRNESSVEQLERNKLLGWCKGNYSFCNCL